MGFSVDAADAHLACPQKFNRPHIMLIVVVFPAPLGPRNPNISPRNIFKERSLTAGKFRCRANYLKKNKRGEKLKIKNGSCALHPHKFLIPLKK